MKTKRFKIDSVGTNFKIGKFEAKENTDPKQMIILQSKKGGLSIDKKPKVLRQSNASKLEEADAKDCSEGLE